jgi:ABC-type nickel/cobalt efflux system permease component RcnA
MTSEISLLALAAATIAFVHTVLGPDHYLPFVAMAKARDWGMKKTIRITMICGVGHLAGSVLLGVIGISLGIQLSSLEWMEGIRANFAAWLLIGFGLAYTAWGIRQAFRNRPHSHWHSHDGTSHQHVHRHTDKHAHVHEASSGQGSLTPWVIFVIFVLGPCEPLIPLLMYPAANESLGGVLTVTIIFGVVTVLTMTFMVALALRGLESFKLKRYERYSHALAGSAVLACGLAVVLLGV